jgi:hypothetical protein
MNPIGKIVSLKMIKKLRSYKLFKPKFGLENYILCSKFEERKYFSKLRTSAHRLCIETGRHKRPVVPKESRFCNFCKDDVEDEQFIQKCKEYSSIRQKLYLNLNFTNISTMNNDDALLFIMSYNNGDTELVKYILDFVKNAWNTRFPKT